MTPEEVEEFRDQILALSPADRLRIAVGLLERGLPRHAEPIVCHVADELTALRLLGRASNTDAQAPAKVGVK